MDIAAITALASLALVSNQATDGVAGETLDIAYGAHERQVLDLYLPSGSGFPCVLFVYGGGWHSGSGKSCAPVAEALRAQGYACALPSHRLAPPDAWPAMIEDVAAAFAWVHAHIAESGGDPARIVLAGHSSGAQLALLLASDPRWLAAHQLSLRDVRAVLALSTPLDLEPRGTDGYGDMLLRGRGAEVFARDAATMRSASPRAYLTKELPPVLLVVGEHDFPMLRADAEAYVDRASELGARVDLVMADGKDHAGVVQALADAREPVARSAFAFLARVTKEVTSDVREAQR